MSIAQPGTAIARTERELLAATRPYAREERWQSWSHTAVGFGLLAASLGAVAAVEAPWLRAVLSLLAGLLVVRCFILYHDFMHRTILGGSRAARWLFLTYGVLTLNPPRIWAETHNYHHNHTARIAGSHIGSFPVLTVGQWRRLSRRQRFLYRLTRHPLNIACGYLTVFLLGMCLRPFLRGPRRYADSGLALLVHGLLVAGVWRLAGLEVMLFTVVVPLVVASALGAYVFYVQHNFPDVTIRERREWSYTSAALDSSAYIEMGPVARWFLGNIGIHHVHHLNPGIPFYRLREAMAEIPELDIPPGSRLRWRDVVHSLRLKLWDPELGKMIGYPRG